MKKQIKKQDWSKFKSFQITKKAQRQVKGGEDKDYIIIEDNIDV